MTTKEEILKLAVECGMATAPGGNGYWDNAAQIEAFYHAARKPLEFERDVQKADIAFLNQQLDEVVLALPYDYLDPPDGGDVSLGEQVTRMYSEVKALRAKVEGEAELRQQLAEKDAEIERLNAVSPEQRMRNLIVYGATHPEMYKTELDELRQQLAAAQLQIKQHREALEVYLSANDPSEFGCACDPSVGHLCGPCFAYKQQTPLRKAIAQPTDTTDTTALEAMIAKAGEVLRERCGMTMLEHYDGEEGKFITEEIRAIPGVKLEDIK